MPSGNRGAGFAVVSGGFAAAAFVVFVLLVWDGAASHTRHSVEAERNAAQYAADAEQRIAEQCTMAEPMAMAECIREIVEATHEHERAEGDLAAQRDMAKWALGMIVVSGAGVLVTAAGVVYVALTLQEARRTTSAAIQGAVAAVEANKTAKEVSSKQLRPYIVYDTASVNFIHKSGAELTVTFRNGGLSPGIVTAASCAVYAPKSRSAGWSEISKQWQAIRVVFGPSQFERIAFTAIEYPREVTFGYLSIGIVLWYQDLTGIEYEDTVWLTYNGSGFRQIGDHGFSLYRPEQEAD